MVPHLEHEEWFTVPTAQEAVHGFQDRAVRSRCEPRKSIEPLSSRGTNFYARRQMIKKGVSDEEALLQ
jgi:hypothetical protein